MQDIFSLLKSKNNFSKKTDKFDKFYFKISFDAIGAYLELINEKAEVLEFVDYKNYTGKLREILKYLENIKSKKSYELDWYQDSSEKLYLSENSFLLDMLKNNPNIVNSDFSKIEFSDKVNHLVLTIAEKDKLNTEIFLQTPEEKIKFKDFKILNEKYLLSENIIYEISPIGEGFDGLSSFNTEIETQDLEKFLSLFYSYFENIDLDYKDYKLVESEIINTEISLIFEQVDQENSLYIKVVESINNLEPDFFEAYNVPKIALINELEKAINISEIISINISEPINEINKLLEKYKKSNKEANYYFHNNLFILNEIIAKEFIYKELSGLLSKYNIFGVDNLENYNIKTVTPKLKLSLNSGIDFLEGDAVLEMEGQEISANEVIKSIKNNSYIKLNDDTNAIISKAYIDKLNRLLKREKNKVKISVFDLPLLEELTDSDLYKDSLKKYKEIFLGFNHLNKIETELPKINADLRPYQQQGYKWLKYLSDNNLGGCLADDMGLGKTLQTITLLSAIYPKEKQVSLIVMPKSLLFNWENELKKFNPNISCYTYYENKRNLEEAQKYNLILTTYTVLRNEVERFRNISFNYVILDESQNIKNINSQSAKAVMSLKAKNRLALSGTPIENNLSELYSLFKFLNPSMFGTFEEFNNNYIVPIQKESNKEITVELKKKIYPFILRRLKKDVLTELPEKIEQTLFVDMNDEQKQLYEERRKFYYSTLKEQISANGMNKSQILILQAMTELRQIASIPESKSEDTIISPKRELLIETLLDVIANGHKVLIFANYLNAIDYISQDLEKEGIEHLIMTGSTKDRKEIVEKFQNQNRYKAFLITLKTGGIGLNLTAADFVFIFDPWWNKSAENQAIDRSHRMGQDKTVFSYKIIVKDTIEEKILQLQEKKMDLFNNIIESDSASFKSFDEKDIEFILGS